MAKVVLTDARIFLAGVDLTGVSNKISVKVTREKKDVVHFASGGWKEALAGLATSDVSASGHWEPTTDSSLALGLGTNSPLSLCPATPVAGDLCWLVSALNGEYDFGGQVGEVAPWSASMSGTSPMARGLTLHPPGTPRTATGVGTGVNLGATGATQKIYVNLHVLSVSGTGTPTITVAVESDDNAGFTSATTIGSFPAATTPGGNSLAIPGPISDTYIRSKWTVSGTNPSFLFFVSAGIA